MEFRDAALAELKTSVEALLEKDRKTIEQKFEDITKRLDAAKDEIIDAIKAGGHTSITDSVSAVVTLTCELADAVLEAMKEVWRRMVCVAPGLQY